MNGLNILLYLMAAIVLAMGVYVGFITRSYNKLLEKLHDTERNLDKAKRHEETDFRFKEKIASELEKSATEARGQLKEIGEKIGEELKEKLKGNVESIDKAAQEAVSLEFDRVRGEITEYKRQKLAEADTKAKEILSEVVRSSLGKGLTEEDQENLVTKALNDAKQRNLF